ncbi:hypothetical protein FACS1894219_02010 [Clostridia bacterium]|nr:hypothetical protein FACS1894219_02010 [Clostridia bacterium]
MKKILLVLLAAAAALTMTACSKDNAKSDTTNPTTQNQTTQAQTEAKPDDSQTEANNDDENNDQYTLNEAFVGSVETEDGEEIIYLAEGDVYGVLGIMCPIEGGSINYAGEVVVIDGYQCTITDVNKGDIVFNLQPSENGYLIELEEFGIVELTPIELEEFYDAMRYIDEDYEKGEASAHNNDSAQGDDSAQDEDIPLDEEIPIE